jgi:cytochrome c oxidase cbb3-type subunit I/II
MREPSSMSEGSIMPAYPHLLEQDLDISTTSAKIKAMQTLGVPYDKGYEDKANEDLMKQANEISMNLQSDSIRVSPKKEIIAIIAYLQRLGKDIDRKNTVITNNP